MHKTTKLNIWDKHARLLRNADNYNNRAWLEFSALLQSRKLCVIYTNNAFVMNFPCRHSLQTIYRPLQCKSNLTFQVSLQILKIAKKIGVKLLKKWAYSERFFYNVSVIEPHFCIYFQAVLILSTIFRSNEACKRPIAVNTSICWINVCQCKAMLLWHRNKYNSMTGAICVDLQCILMIASIVVGRCVCPRDWLGLRTLRSIICTASRHKCVGCSINKLQNGVILLFF